MGTLDSSRCLDFIARPVVGQEHALQEISRGESERVEMKSSLLYDYQKASHNPQASMNELRSDLVLHASLKTVAAFPNEMPCFFRFAVAFRSSHSNRVEPAR